MYDIAAKKYVGKMWKDIKPGMIVKVKEDEFFPADMIVLKSFDSKGGLYVETKNLDGETNLKSKSV